MSESFVALVEPSVLKWARDSIGYSIPDVVKKLKLNEVVIEEWESGHSHPTYSQLEKLASIYKRPVVAFLLKEPPREPPLPQDFRMHHAAEKKGLTPKMRLVIRQARWMQYSAVELRKELGLPLVRLSATASLTDDPEIIARRMKTELGINGLAQSQRGDYEKAFEQWKNLLEKAGVLVFQLSMPQKEIRGFSFPDGELPALIIKRSDEPPAKIFTLFHELPHLLLNEGGICDLGERISSKENVHETPKVEKFCNHFAGAFLVSLNELINHPVVKQNRGIMNWTEDQLKKVARHFSVSKEVILRRLLYCGLTTAGYYKKKHDQWRAEHKERKPFGKRDDVKRCLQERGKRYVEMVFEANKRGRINELDVAGYLGVKLDKIEAVQESLER